LILWTLIQIKGSPCRESPTYQHLEIGERTSPTTTVSLPLATACAARIQAASMSSVPQAATTCRPEGICQVTAFMPTWLRPMSQSPEGSTAGCVQTRIPYSIKTVSSAEKSPANMFIITWCRDPKIVRSEHFILREWWHTICTVRFRSCLETSTSTRMIYRG
jgi:hypothetical protein